MEKLNLATDPWVKLRFRAPTSLIDFFHMEKAPELDGTPAERFVVFRLLLAILQASCPLELEWDLENLTIEDMKRRAADYLNSHAAEFELYDANRPFLQYPAVVSKEKSLSTGSLVIGVCVGNATRLFESNCERRLTPAEEAYILLLQVILGFSGKKPDAQITIAKGLKKKIPSPASPSLGRSLLHTFPLGEDLFATLRLNLLTREDLEMMPFLREGMGVPPWERMPDAEVGESAERYASSYMGRLIPLAHFCHLLDGRMHMTSGITYPVLKETGIADPSVSLKKSKEGQFSAVTASTEKQPWRQLEAVLAFGKGDGCRLLELRSGMSGECRGMWCVGLMMSEQGGDQYFSGTDGFVEEVFRIQGSWSDSGFMNRYSRGLAKLEHISKMLCAAVANYYREISAVDDIKKNAFIKKKENAARSGFWKLCDVHGEAFVEGCMTGTQASALLTFVRCAETAYADSCSTQGARNLMMYVKNQPRFGKLVKELNAMRSEGQK